MSLVNAHQFARLGLHRRKVVRWLTVHEDRGIVTLESDVPAPLPVSGKSTKEKGDRVTSSVEQGWKSKAFGLRLTCRFLHRFVFAICASFFRFSIENEIEVYRA